MKLNTEEFVLIRDLIYEETGMYFSEIKNDFLSRRVEKRIIELDLTDAREYFRYLRVDVFNKELQKLIELSVTYETYFFRDYPQLKFLAEEILPLIIEKKTPLDRTIRVLSAGCSTGEEPYTLGIIFKEILDKPAYWDLQIDAFDISNDLLQKAKTAIYSHRSVKETPMGYLMKYFTESKSGYVLNEEIKKLVNFSQRNIFDPVAMNRINYYDLVFCRNVLIYFDQNSTNSVLQNLFRSMKKDAFIFLGAAESLGRVSTLFEMKKIDNNIAYQK